MRGGLSTPAWRTAGAQSYTCKNKPRWWPVPASQEAVSAQAQLGALLIEVQRPRCGLTLPA